MMPAGVRCIPPLLMLKMYCFVRTWRLAAEALEKVINPPRSFEPLGNEMVAGVYVDLPQSPGAGVDELVRHAGWHHNDLTAPRLDNVLAGGERRAALLHHEDHRRRGRYRGEGR